MADSEGRIKEIGNVIKMTLEASCPDQYGEIADFFFFTHKGVGIIVKDSSLQLGFGVLSGLTPSIELLSAIDHINKTMNGWYVWLSEGADNDNWSLIAGQKIFYGVTNEEKLIDLVRIVASSHESVLQVILNNLPNIQGSTFWKPELDNIDSYGFLLMVKLG